MKLVIGIDDTTYETIKNSTFFIKGGRGSGRTIENNALMAIYDGKPLEQEHCEDAISRQAVLDIAKSSKSNWIDNSVLFKKVNELPPVTPKTSLDENKEPITLWHTITGYNKDLSYDANREDGVDLPDVSRDVLVIYPGIKGVYAKISSEEGMDGTSYYNGVLWAYYEKPMEVKNG